MVKYSFIFVILLFSSCLTKNYFFVREYKKAMKDTTSKSLLKTNGVYYIRNNGRKHAKFFYQDNTWISFKSDSYDLDTIIGKKLPTPENSNAFFGSGFYTISNDTLKCYFDETAFIDNDTYIFFYKVYADKIVYVEGSHYRENRFIDREESKVKSVYEFIETSLKPDSSKIRFKNQRWYKRLKK
jgi:hypothetical protein